MKTKIFYYCTSCGYRSTKWLGKCPECGEWNTFEEVQEEEKKSFGEASYTTVSLAQAETLPRLFSGEVELDRVIGGFVPGQTILLAGEPGVGKSTLLLHLADIFAEKKRVCYLHGEESASQIKLRALRLGITKDFWLLGETRVEMVLEFLAHQKPDILLVDSVQMLELARYSSPPGSILQVRESTQTLVRACKSQGILLILVGHITKSGQIAGPKIIEHLVDTVLFFEQDKKGLYRIIRSLKNRFYATDEWGIFEMTSTGIHSLSATASLFRHEYDNLPAGVSFYPLLDGNRVIPVEVQAIVVTSSFSYPRRTAEGFDINRLYILLAVLERQLNYQFSKLDVYVNITSGLDVEDTALDLAVISALISTYTQIPLSLSWLVFGEVGLAGEIRMVRGGEKRIDEGFKLGFSQVFYPYGIKTQKAEGVKPLRHIQELALLIENSKNPS
ncbi:DNA repair protein RadA [Thermospira aquatica]|uniref:DNA repair protein RadA n=1 Tax=Thermospira aquatica TaxID=2828656 RepID=A0AAX3BED5_9SPIR|nr:DNA repair protein RadA [Thermospira aquatica]URA10463.1 DNA repair protein RadA [Thermospira aquatica]